MAVLRPAGETLADEKARPRRWVGTLVRVAVTVGLLAVLAFRLDVRAIGRAFMAARPGPLAAAFLCIFVAIAVSAVKWSLILRRRGVRVGYLDTVRLYFVGLFFNNVLPTSVGGDVVRAWALGKETGQTVEAVSSVASERLIASLALGLSSCVALPFVEVTPRLLILVAGFLLVDAALLVLFVVPRFAPRIAGLIIPKRFERTSSGTTEVLAAVRASLLDWPLSLRVLVLTLVFQAFVALVNYFLFQALGYPVGLGQCLVYTPMISTLTMIPISLSGLGVREAAYVYFFSRHGVPEAASVAVSLAFFVCVAIATLPGAPLFLVMRRKAQTNA